MSVRDLVILGSSSQQPTRLRNHGAYLLRWNDEGLLFDPGEGTQRQFIFANVAPTCVTRIFVSHFHGDHCLGLGSMLMRLNLDKITHPVHCYYPASGKVYFDRLRFGTLYHDHVNVIEHPVSSEGIVHQDEKFTIEARFLDHGVDNVGWRVTEPDSYKFDKEKLDSLGIKGPMVREIGEKGQVLVQGKLIKISDVSSVRKGDAFAVVIDTRYTESAVKLAQNAKLFLCESTYLERHRELAEKYHHLTAKQAAEIAKKAEVKQLILTHYSARYQDLSEFQKEAMEIFPHTLVADDLLVFPFPK
ncbi:MAG: ribonuclease Z [Chlamydiae bacterium]|nr:ribonuclease Z [Chlamydiota bacterium]